VAVFQDYTPSPEAKYPTAIHQIYATAKWVSLHGEEIGVNGENLAIAGNSVGGNMTASVVLMAKEKKGPEIKLQVLLWPVTDANFDTVSYKTFGEERFLTRNMMIWFGIAICLMWKVVKKSMRLHYKPLQINWKDYPLRLFRLQRTMCCGTKAKPMPVN